jgi:hypothetical protein
MMLLFLSLWLKLLRNVCIVQLLGIKGYNKRTGDQQQMRHSAAVLVP